MPPKKKVAAGPVEVAAAKPGPSKKVANLMCNAKKGTNWGSRRLLILQLQQIHKKKPAQMSQSASVQNRRRKLRRRYLGSLDQM